jgi:hypothetical protein
VRHVVQSFEVVVTGEVGPTLVEALEGFDIVRLEGGRTHLMGRVESQSGLYDLLAILGSLGLRLVSLNPVSDPAYPHR